MPYTKSKGVSRSVPGTGSTKSSMPKRVMGDQNRVKKMGMPANKGKKYA